MTLEKAVALQVPFVDLKHQHESLLIEIQAHIGEVISSSSFILGKAVQEFESAYADYCRVRHCIGVASGTDALALALMGSGIGKGDEVITAANTFVATVEAIVHANATPVLVDIDPRTYTLDTSLLEKAVCNRTKAIIPVHLYGQPADIAPVLELASRHEIIVLEDAAQAHGAEYRGQRVGSFGKAGCFSFYPTKNLGAWGDAGAIVTNDDELAKNVRMLRDHGGTTKYQHDRVGFNSRLDAIQAAVLTVKLRSLDRWNEMRKASAAIYDKLLGEIIGVTPPYRAPDRSHVYHLYVIRVPTSARNGLRDYLSNHGVSTGIHYPKPIQKTKAFASLAQEEQPRSEEVAAQIISLPMYSGLSLLVHLY